MTSCYFRPNKKGKAVLAAGKRLARRAPDYGTWWIRYRDAAGQHARERTEARMEAEAQQFAHEKATHASRVAAGLDRPAPVPMTCDELFARYLEDHSHLGSQGPMRSQVRKWLQPHFKRMPVAAVTSAHCEALLTKSRKADQADATVRQLHIRSRAIFGYGVRLGARRDNPWAEVPRPLVVPNKPRFLSRAQVTTLLDGAGAFRALLFTALLTGLRRGEIAALRWDDVHWDEGPCGVLHVARSWSRKTTKDGEVRLVPIHPTLRPELESAFAARSAERADASSDSLVFPSPRHGGMRHHAWHTAELLRRVAARAGVSLPPGFTFHDLRKTFLTHLIRDSGGNVGAGQLLAGHSSPDVTATYYYGSDVDYLAEVMGGLKLSPSDVKHTADTRHLSAVQSATGGTRK